MQKPKLLTILQVLHLLTFILAIVTITILHLSAENFWDVLRIPQLISDLNPFFGFSWPASLHIYQFILTFVLIVALINSLGLIFYKSKSWRIASDVSSFIGFLIIWPVTLFLIYILVTAENLSFLNIQTLIIYFAFTQLIFIIDLITWFVDEESFGKKLRRD